MRKISSTTTGLKTGSHVKETETSNLQPQATHFCEQMDGSWKIPPRMVHKGVQPTDALTLTHCWDTQKIT